MAERTSHLEARCDELQATVDILIQRIAVLEARDQPVGIPPPLDISMPDSSIDVLLAQAGHGEVLMGDGGHGPLDTAMVPSPSPGGVETPTTGELEVENLIREAEDVGMGIYDDDVRELLMFSEVTPSADGAAEPPFNQTADVLEELLPATTADVTQEQPSADLPSLETPAPTSSDAAPQAAQADDAQADAAAPQAAQADDAQADAAAAQAAQADDAPAAEFAPPPTGVLHLILGDSIAAYLNPPLHPGHQLLNLAVRGSTWALEDTLIHDHLREWESEAAQNGLELGHIFLWLGGNDAYGRPGAAEAPRALCERTVQRVLTKLQRHTGRIILAGPTPRLWHDIGRQWESTPAFTANDCLMGIASSWGIRFIPYLGRTLTAMRQRRHVVREDVAPQWFAKDGVHLSVQGYAKVLAKLGGLFQ